MKRDSLTVFAGSFLLFLVQPMLGKALLPEYGGSAAVWTVCLLFFQLLLLAGYAWAHVARPLWHAGAVLLSLLWLPLAPRIVPGAPTYSILASLLLTVGLPYLVLAATSPLLQKWRGGSLDASLLRLYAISNAGSLLALLGYPVLIEPWLSLRSQYNAWTAGYLLFALGCLFSARNASPAVESPPARGPVWLWIALAACGSALLSAATNQISQEIAPMPFLWILPLAIYLVTFVLCFDRPALYRRDAIGVLCGLSIVTACVTATLGTRLSMLVQVTAPLLALFLCLMVCHGELVRARPEGAGQLTRYYLAIALGGALGGAFVALAAPRLFDRYLEYPFALAATCALAAMASHREEGRLRWNNRLRALALGAATCSLLITPTPALESSRNFFGVLRVTETKEPSGRRLRLLTHGQTTHGLQNQKKDTRSQPTAYYGWNSAAGIVLADRAPTARIGIVGLGIGTLARYGKPGQTIRIYELDPDVIRLARSHFFYLADSAARVELIEGDARVRLRSEPPQGFDVLVVDAFSSDSIPAHLLTREAAAIYRRHLRDDGVLLVHISNRMLKLEPVVAAMARHIGWSAQYLHSGGDTSRATYDANWMVLAARPQPLPGARPATAQTIEWTDDFASIWRVLE